MDKAFAIKPQIPALGTFKFQPIGIAERVVHPVDCNPAIGPRGRQADLQGLHQRHSVSPVAQSKILGQVVRPHDDPRQTRVGCDVRRPDDAQRRFHHSPKGFVRHKRSKTVKILGPVDLGQQDPITGSVRHRNCVRLAPFGIQGVDPHDPGPTAIATFCQFGGKRLAPLSLFGGQYCILQIKKDGVRTQPARLVERAWARRGDIQG